MPSLVFPPLPAGAGVIYTFRMTTGQMRRLLHVAQEVGAVNHAGGTPAVGALLRAVAAGAVVLRRADEPEAAAPAPAVHRGCPVD